MHLSGASCAPCFMGQGREAYTPAGLVLDAEYNRYADLLEAIRDEARSRLATTEDANERLLILTRYALICDDHLPPALTAEVARTWGVEA